MEVCRICTTKAIYRHLSTENIVTLPAQGSRSVLPGAQIILNKTWKSRSLPPVIKAFTWRLIRRALATAQRATRYTPNHNNHCDSCNQVEDDAHLFFHCDLPRAVWHSFSPAIITHHLPRENDGVQNILQAIINDQTPEPVFSKILFTLWYIWKARNDFHFRRVVWTPAQVHNATTAHYNSYLQAQQEEDPISVTLQRNSGMHPSCP